MKAGDKWDLTDDDGIGRDYEYDEKLKIEIWEMDDSNDDDLIGYVIVDEDTEEGDGRELQVKNRHGAKYIINYDDN